MAKPKKPARLKKPGPPRGPSGRFVKEPEPRVVYRWINGRRRPIA